MRYLKNYESALKGRKCNHNYFMLDEYNGVTLVKCSKCYRIIEDRDNRY